MTTKWFWDAGIASSSSEEVEPSAEARTPEEQEATEERSCRRQMVNEGALTYRYCCTPPYSASHLQEMRAKLVQANSEVERLEQARAERIDGSPGSRTHHEQLLAEARARLESVQVQLIDAEMKLEQINHDAVEDAREKVLVELLEQERALRKAPESLAAMEQAEASVQSEWMQVVEGLQEKIIRDYRNQTDSAHDFTVLDLRLAALRHPEIAFWVKFNRARLGHLRVGDAAPDVAMKRAADGKSVSLFHSSKPDRPMVLVAGSLS